MRNYTINPGDELYDEADGSLIRILRKHNPGLYDCESSDCIDEDIGEYINFEPRWQTEAEIRDVLRRQGIYCKHIVWGPDANTDSDAE